MTSVNDPEYVAGLLEFSRRLRVVHRDLGDPSYETVAKACGVSVTTVHRYLTGKTLPPWRFVARYMERVPFVDDARYELGARRAPEVEQEIAAQLAVALRTLRTAWASARNVLRPIDGPGGGRLGQLYQLPGLPDDQDPPDEQDPSATRRRLA
jgi:transcriptional regulator with XRE-family HTH domain